MTRTESPASPALRGSVSSTRAAPVRGGRRPEIEGLRTVAALLVATYHIWFGKVSGGVDVFFVVTGFLITLTLAGQVRDHGRIRPLAYLGRLARRVWPGAAVVLLAVLAVTVTLTPEALRPRNFAEVLASTWYVENWYLSANAVDYLNSEDPHTPAQHFWAMSLQGQFYLLWLAIAVVALAVAVRRRGRFTTVFAWLILAATVASFAWSIWQTTFQQPAAYFSTLTRIWEFGVGALLALAGRRVALGGTGAALASWVGLAGLVACGIVLPVAGVFPGWAALWPVTCAALLLVATRRDERSWSATRLLSARPLVRLGGVAFGIYLWHWPLLVSYRYLRGMDATPGILAGSVIIASSIVLAILTNRLVERRVVDGWGLGSHARASLAAILVGVWIAVTALAAVGSARAIAETADLERSAAQAEDALGTCFGAAALDDPASCEVGLAEADPVPERAALLSDTGGAYGCYTPADATELEVCTYGSGATRVALIGNSHAAMFGPRLGELADSLGWTLDVMVGNGCVWNTQRPGDPDVTDRCAPRLQQAEERLFGAPYDVVLFAGGRGAEAADRGVVEAIAANWRDLREAGSRVVVIEDNPRIGDSGAGCIVRSSNEDLRAGACDLPVAEATSIPDRFAAAARLVGDIPIVPMLDLYCDPDRCPAVIGGVVVYRDAHHVTGTYTRTTVPALIERLASALE